MSQLKNRLRDVAEIQARIFNRTLNPTNKRTGAKFLSRNLRGPSLINYYGNPDFIKFKQVKAIFPNIKLIDPEEYYRVSRVEFKKSRGKGAPKKLKEAKATTKRKK
ncbi:hypothetical protein TBLA_0H02310 [Henningerozyma blattae CBS 6284]|uniref:Small ribosomal subunit protein mS33 n=1 Tax=Henningerozyma blattae (strain ATCC 34711 / CBS 6284 / DSM 70876 / NBRC 10599 / NRRL Y-10934 / UCD 77-7) TaxID=1071380 RepID=I2H814_HENB6|nr:hypothetical protein TBLA_0H02310 [Tetrapisispora blattae CBS 6284]CCH62516.1 hypothetical protein TBLA_0H02310 [Tetrapisispora blattae CBS 6284]